MYEQLKAVLVEDLSIDEDKITPDANLMTDLEINSLELADLMMTCEERFDIVISDDDMESLVTVGDVVRYLEERV